MLDANSSIHNDVVVEMGGDAVPHLAEKPAAVVSGGSHSRTSSQDALTGFNDFSHRVADEFRHGLPSIRKSLSELSIVSLNSVDGPLGQMKKNFCDFTDEEK